MKKENMKIIYYNGATGSMRVSPTLYLTGEGTLILG